MSADVFPTLYFGGSGRSQQYVCVRRLCISAVYVYAKLRASFIRHFRNGEKTWDKSHLAVACGVVTGDKTKDETQQSHRQLQDVARPRFLLNSFFLSGEFRRSFHPPVSRGIPHLVVILFYFFYLFGTGGNEERTCRHHSSSTTPEIGNHFKRS